MVSVIWVSTRKRHISHRSKLPSSMATRRSWDISIVKSRIRKSVGATHLRSKIRLTLHGIWTQDIPPSGPDCVKIPLTRSQACPPSQGICPRVGKCKLFHASVYLRIASKRDGKSQLQRLSSDISPESKHILYNKEELCCIMDCNCLQT